MHSINNVSFNSLPTVCHCTRQIAICDDITDICHQFLSKCKCNDHSVIRHTVNRFDSSSRNENYLGGIIALLLQDHRTMSTKSVCSSQYMVTDQH